MALAQVKRLLDDGQPVAFDSTGLYRMARQEVLGYGKRRRIPIRCLWVDTPVPVCRGRQKAKGRPRRNLFFDRCVRLLHQAVSTDLLAEPFASYHQRVGISGGHRAQDDACYEP